MLYAIFAKVNKLFYFLLATLGDETVPKVGVLLKEIICSSKTKFFSTCKT